MAAVPASVPGGIRSINVATYNGDGSATVITRRITGEMGISQPLSGQRGVDNRSLVVTSDGAEEAL